MYQILSELTGFCGRYDFLFMYVSPKLSGYYRAICYYLMSERTYIKHIECVYLVMLMRPFLLLSPWPWSNDFAIWIWPRYSNKVPAHQKSSFYVKAFKLRAQMWQTDTHTDTHIHDWMHYQPHSQVININTMQIYMEARRQHYSQSHQWPFISFTWVS